MRSAASLVLVRDVASQATDDNQTRTGKGGIEVLLVQRGDAGDFPGLHVFPGGLVDQADSDRRLQSLSRRDSASANALLKSGDALPYFIAAVRESLEEVGVLLAADLSVVACADSRRSWQRRLLDREQGFADLIASLSMQLATDALGYFSHWVTPAGIPRRYDTRFFVAEMPADQNILVDGREAVRADWLSPQAALAAHTRNDIRLIFPTIRNLEALAAFTSVAELLAHTQAPRTVPMMLPKVVNTEDGMRLLLPGDQGYDVSPA